MLHLKLITNLKLVILKKTNGDVLVSVKTVTLTPQKKNRKNGGKKYEKRKEWFSREEMLILWPNYKTSVLLMKGWRRN